MNSRPPKNWRVALRSTRPTALLHGYGRSLFVGRVDPGESRGNPPPTPKYLAGISRDCFVYAGLARSSLARLRSIPYVSQ
jgi:hypothetical protein